ncbi:MAG: MBL fold metallo-hydrolase [Allosphingosinicella sp.]
MRLAGLAAMLAMLAAGGAATAQPQAIRPVFVTLGTAGGPIPNPVRSQPANAVVIGDDVILMDAGDGAAGRLAAAGLRLDQVRAVFLSHLHLDHTAGLAGVVGLRWMNDMRGPFRVYGPPGTQALVDGIVASMAPARIAGFGFDHGYGSHAVRVDVTELGTSGPVEVLPGNTVSSVENSHYSYRPGSPQAAASKALSFRLEARGRSIVYTGDTGPSGAVTRLARGADLLVSEVQNLPALEETIRRFAPDMTVEAHARLSEHLRLHHISPEQVGAMAAEAGVGGVVLTHLGPAPPPDRADPLFIPGVRTRYQGPVAVAVDLGRY